MKQPLKIKEGTSVNLSDFDPSYTGKYKDKSQVKEKMKKLRKEMTELQRLLYAENKHSLLIILQAMDAAGKDGTIRNVMYGVNPQGCQVTSFKVPTPEELEHDFLWRIHKAVPNKGNIGIFNRSHYEDVLVVRVHNIVPEEVWSQRYEQINNFEKLLVDTGTVIIKFFLHISKDEQKRRFIERLENPKKNWKFSLGDLDERKLWDKYMLAYQDAISKCSTEYAPWYIIPANNEWYRDYVVAKTIVKTMKKLNMKYPEPKEDLSKVKVR